MSLLSSAIPIAYVCCCQWML